MIEQTSRSTAVALAALFFSALLAGCPKTPETEPTAKTEPAAETVAAPTMPSGWKVTSDVNFKAADIKPVQRRLGGEIKALRNTDYEVNGKRVKVNTIVAATDGDAEKIWAALAKSKPSQFLVRKGSTFYEFVGPDAALAEMTQGRAHLAGQ